jgi:hypothetical protein
VQLRVLSLDSDTIATTIQRTKKVNRVELREKEKEKNLMLTFAKSKKGVGFCFK